MYLRKYGTQTTINFPLIKRDVVDFATSSDYTFASGDCEVKKDEGAGASSTNSLTYEGEGVWSLVLTATEMQAARVVVTVIDSATKAVEDQCVIVETFGHASAQFAVDLSDGVRAGLTALPNAAADAAGGLPISDAGGLDLDAKIGALTYGTANRVNVQVYGMEANTLTATAIAADAITAAKIANGAIDAATFAADVDAEILSYLVDDATRIDASALNTHAAITVAGIADGVWDEDLTGHTTADTAGQILGDVATGTPPTAAAIADAVWDEAASGHVTAGTFGKLAADVLDDTGTSGVAIADGSLTRAKFAADTGLQSVRSNTAQSGATGSITLDASASATSQFYMYALVYLTGGTGAGQVRRIIDYNGTTKVAAVQMDWETAPDNTTTFAILPETIAIISSGSFTSQSITTDALADGLLTAAKIATAAITDTKLASNAITAAKIADGAITAGKIATDAIDADALSADAVTAIQSGLATSTELAKVPKSDGTASWNATALAAIQGEAADALVAYDPPTNAELEARTLVAASYGTAANQTTITTHLTDIKGATWSALTDTLEAIRDRGDAAWTTATGFSTLDAAGVRTAVGLASANLDTQLADLPTVAEFEARTLVAANYFDPAADTVANVTTVGSVTTKTGYKLASDGLDLVLVDGKTLPAAMQIMGAVVAGKISGAGTGTEVFLGLDGLTTRVTVTVDGDGNRSSVVYA